MNTNAVSGWITRKAVLGLLGLMLFPLAAHANIILQYGMCTTAEGCDQSIGFTPQQTAVLVTGDTNPPPVYDVYAQSLDPNTSLNGNGSTLENGFDTTSNLYAMPTFTLSPQSPWAWSTIEFQLDLLNGAVTVPSSGLTFAVTDQFGNVTTIAANIPWEGNKGENQHYTLTGTNGELIRLLQVSYVDPTGGTNGLEDMHNIDVHSVTVPEPTTIALLGIGLLGLGLRRRGRAT